MTELGDEGAQWGGRLPAEAGGDDPYRQGQVATQPDDPPYLLRVLGAVCTRDAQEQFLRLDGAQHVQEDFFGLGQCGQPAPARDDDQAAGRARQQRADLGAVHGVVEYHDRLAARHVRTPARLPGRHAERDRAGRQSGVAQQLLQGGLRRQRRDTGREPVQVDEEATVRIPFRDVPGRLDGERRLADAAHPADRVDGCEPAVGIVPSQPRVKVGQGRVPTREVRDAAGESAPRMVGTGRFPGREPPVDRLQKPGGIVAPKPVRHVSERPAGTRVRLDTVKDPGDQFVGQLAATHTPRRQRPYPFRDRGPQLRGCRRADSPHRAAGRQ
ncbi:hypothetical protein Prum_021470 [Phytohabitans rumicis]|uniref:Uncharacterized protein n=1 Tax=Phytohabitans rumicis TaxID=1076125 RepID=A0A6V8L772_9ACTN|nr:hypothetical protein Prum_021470 [Phytohabitans rumicis]